MIRTLSTVIVLGLLAGPALAAPGTKECRTTDGYSETEFGSFPDGYPVWTRTTGKHIHACYVVPEATAEATVQSGGSPAADRLSDQQDSLGIDIDLGRRDLD